MRILHIPNYYNPHIGGIETVAEDIVNSLKDKHEQRVICFKDSKGTVTENVNGVLVTRVSCIAKVASQSIAPGYKKELKRIMNEFKPEVVIFHYPNPFVAAFLRKYLKRNFKFVLYWHLDIVKQKVLGKLFNPQTKALLERDLIQKEIKEGMSTAVIDKLVYDYTVGHGAIPAPLNYEGFPKSVCTSINEVVCHGIPSEKEILRDGDIINVDVSTILDGYYSDASRMFMIGNVSPEKQKLVQVAKECLEIGMKAAKPFGFVGDIGNAIQKHAEKNGFSVVRDLCGHGVGLEFHEEPEVCHFGRKGTGMLLVPGMVFTIEPMINMGTWKVFIDEEDGWTVITEDELPSAQWEHTFLMTETGLEILTY